MNFATGQEKYIFIIKKLSSFFLFIFKVGRGEVITIILHFNAESDILKLDFMETEIDQLSREFMDHPSGQAKKKSHVVYLKALGLPHQEIVRIARVSGDSVMRYLKKYAEKAVWLRFVHHRFIVLTVRYCRTGKHLRLISMLIHRIPSPKPRMILKSSPASNFR